MEILFQIIYGSLPSTGQVIGMFENLFYSNQEAIYFSYGRKDNLFMTNKLNLLICDGKGLLTFDVRNYFFTLRAKRA